MQQQPESNRDDSREALLVLALIAITFFLAAVFTVQR
jgi:hypothetical protein